MAVCFDYTGIIYSFIISLTNNLTGSIFLSTFLIALILIIISVGIFRIPVEFMAIILLPLHLAFLACLGTDWLAITGTLLIYIGIIFGKNFFLR